MSIRILFAKAKDAASGDGPEKTKSKTKNMFRMATGQSLQPDGRQQPLCIKPGEDEDEDDSVIEVDLQCFCKFALLLVSLLCFGVSIFACGAVYAASHAENPEPPHSVAFATPNPAPTIRRIPSSNANATTAAAPETPTTATTAETQHASDTAETLATPQTPNTGTGTVEYIQLKFQLTQSRDGAIGTLDQCVRLMLQSTAFKVEELLLERYGVLIRPSTGAGVGDRMLEYLNERDTRTKLEACSKVTVDSESSFVYR